MKYLFFPHIEIGRFGHLCSTLCQNRRQFHAHCLRMKMRTQFDLHGWLVAQKMLYFKYYIVYV